MQKNKNVKNVKKYVKKVTSNRNVKPNKKRIYESNKYIEMCIKIYIYNHENKQNISECMQKNIYLKL